MRHGDMNDGGWWWVGMVESMVMVQAVCGHVFGNI